MAVAGDVISGDHIQDSKTGQVVQLDPSTHTPPPPNPLIHQTHAGCSSSTDPPFTEFLDKKKKPDCILAC